MGLDMYLRKKYYVWSNERDNLRISGAKIPMKGEKITEIVAEAGYWRKANAIHGWFVKNVQDGEDDCKEYYVSREQMQELLDTVNKVLAASKLVDGKVRNGISFKDGKEVPMMETGKVIKDPSVAKELLPVTAGFFFGNYDEETAYDQYYYEDLVLTKEIIEKALASDKGWDFDYQSSW